VPLKWREEVKEAEMEALRAVFAVALGLAAIGWITGACLGQHKLHATLNRDDDDDDEDDN